MSVLSILKSFKFEAKVLIPFLLCTGILFKTVHSINDREKDVNVEKLPYCDEQLINDRGNSKK